MSFLRTFIGYHPDLSIDELVTPRYNSLEIISSVVLRPNYNNKNTSISYKYILN